MKKLTFVALVGLTVGLAGCATTPNRTSAVYEYPVQHPVTSSNNYARTVAYATSPQEDYNKKVIKQGILGAATGAIAAEASGGKAGTGALVGAGTNVLGGALLDMLTAPQSQPQQVQQYAPYVQQWSQQNPNMDRVVRKFDSNGNIISEEVFKR